jgi:opacity protein-like surface antigen
MKLRNAIAGLAALIASPAMAADYLPFGAQTGVSIGTVTGGGWTLCYQETMGTAFGSSASTTLAGCSGDRLMLAGRETGSDTLLVLAQALKVDALFDTGAGNNGVFHNANGSDWFYADNWSWGFKTPGTDLTKLQCDFSSPNGSMCVHTLNFVGGYSINEISGLNDDDRYEKLVFSFNGGAGVPEPSTWALMIGGFGLAGAAIRRRRMLAA